MDPLCLTRKAALLLGHVALAIGLAAGTAAGAAQTRATDGSGTILVRVVDARVDAAVAGAVLRLRPAADESAARPALRGSTNTAGEFPFEDVAHGRYTLEVERFGYMAVTLEVTLDRAEPLVLSIMMEPVPFPLGPLAPARANPGGATLLPPPASADPAARVPDRRAAVRARQLHFLASDARQLSHADLREANALLEDDVFRTLQRGPGVATRDDYSADLWTRGAPASQTSISFDGVPLIGAFHALGMLGGLNTDALLTATFQPGVTSASQAAGGAGSLEVVSRSAAEPVAGSFALSPLTARLAAGARLGARAGLNLAARRSYLDAQAAQASRLTGGQRTVPYAFADLTARTDVAISAGHRVEASAFWQADRVFGDVPDVAYGNAGEWGARLARATLVSEAGGNILRNTIGWSAFDASVRARPASPLHRPLHPRTENHYRTLLWESRLESPSGELEPWSVGVRATHETHEYDGPGIDLARLLSPDELARRGIGDLSGIIDAIQRAHLLRSQSMTRVAVWGEKRKQLGADIAVKAGLRLETGDPAGDASLRLAPRVRLRYQRPQSPLSISAGYGRVHQYVQSTARTDVLRTGLRASEVLIQADAETPALTSDLLTIGLEAWAGENWLLGSTAWLRDSRGLLLPEPAPGVIDGPRPAVPASGRAQGIEVSARKLAGRTRGFANYTLAWSRQRVRSREFFAPEDRRHVGNLGVLTDLLWGWQAGATLHAQSGAPYTRITLVSVACEATLGCSSYPPVLYGAPGGQRAPAWATLDLMTQWTLTIGDASIDLYAQLRNALGSANAATYHSSCICISGDADSGGELRDRFDRGLPRLPVLGLRARF